MSYLEGYLAIGVVFLVWGWYRGWRTPQKSTEKFTWAQSIVGTLLFIALWPIFMLRVLAKWDKQNMKGNK